MKKDLDKILTKKEREIFKKLNTPAKIQTFLNNLKFNFQKKDETIYAPRFILERGLAQCAEGALLAYFILKYHQKEVWLMDLRSTKDDLDHVITIFKEGGYFGAISKTVHNVLRYRDPIYKSPRELAMSYFHEFFLASGKKTMRDFSKLFSLEKFSADWFFDNDLVEKIVEELDLSPHEAVAPKKNILKIRPVDKIEIRAYTSSFGE